MEGEKGTDATAEAPKKSKLWLWVVLIIIAIGIVAAVLLLRKTDNAGTSATADQNETTTETKTETKKVEVWKDGGVAVAGKYADADVVDLGNGSFRMYYAAEPEIANFKSQVYSAISTDGVTWTAEKEIRQGSTFPDVIKLPDGRWRMYYQSNQVIKSAVSTDGLNFTDESGTRIDKTESGFDITNVAASSTVRLADGTYLMVYRGLIDKAYETSEKLPNQTMQLFFYATSPDGLTWTKKGVALDSRNETLLGLADGAELVNLDEGWRLYFWSYKGIYHTTYENGTFGATPVFDFALSTNSQTPFPENPPSDPTLANIAGKWHMYYGQHTKGIYFATLSKE